MVQYKGKRVEIQAIQKDRVLPNKWLKFKIKSKIISKQDRVVAISLKMTLNKYPLA